MGDENSKTKTSNTLVADCAPDTADACDSVSDEMDSSNSPRGQVSGNALNSKATCFASAAPLSCSASKAVPLSCSASKAVPFSCSASKAVPFSCSSSNSRSTANGLCFGGPSMDSCNSRPFSGDTTGRFGLPTFSESKSSPPCPRTFATLMKNIPRSTHHGHMYGTSSFYDDYNNRVASFDHRWKWHSPDEDLCPSSMAACGYYLIDSVTEAGKLTVKCYSCGKTLTNFNGGEIPFVSHSLHHKNCNMVSDVYIYLHRSSSLWQYADIRIGSFWWYRFFEEVGRVHALKWAEAGFFYDQAHSDNRQLMCYSCGYVVSDDQLETTSNPWELHKLRCHHRRITVGYSRMLEDTRNHPLFKAINAHIH